MQDWISVKPEEKIVGGTNVTITDRAFQVAFLYNHTLRCGGSWIGGNAILTAAHCCDEANPSLISIRVGSNKHNSEGDVSVIEINCLVALIMYLGIGLRPNQKGCDPSEL